MRVNRDSKTTRLLLSIGVVALIATAAFILFPRAPVNAASQEEIPVLAKVGSVEITSDNVEEALSNELQQLDRQRHELMERGMEQAIDQELINLEAASQGVTPAELMSNLYAQLVEPTSEQVDAFYEARKAQITQPKEQVVPQIMNYLRQQDRQRVHTAFMQDLKSRYAVERYLEPIRIQVASADAPSVGPETAPVTIIEFSDFQCPYCQRVAPTLDKVVETYGEQVRLVFRQFPLPIHADAPKAAEASLCAAEAGKFWEMHDKMFENIRALSVDQLKVGAESLGLDQQAFAECLDSGRYADQVAADLQAGREAGVNGTPAIFVNGRFLNGAVPFEQIAAVIDDEIERASRK